jgi:hypothetical protein
VARNHAPAWSNAWLRQLPWRELIRMCSLSPDEAEGIQLARIRRLHQELARRKREGGGGWAAKGGEL